MIICAAIKLIKERNNKYTDAGYVVRPDELVVCGLRHGNCIQTIKELDEKWHSATRIQGFITDEGKFIDRRHAFVYACQCGQLSHTTKWYKQDHNQDELYSEDLY